MYPDAFALGLMVGRAKLRYRSIKVIPGGGRPETSGDGSEGREDVMELPFAHLRGEVSKPNHDFLLMSQVCQESLACDGKSSTFSVHSPFRLVYRSQFKACQLPCFEVPASSHSALYSIISCDTSSPMSFTYSSCRCLATANHRFTSYIQYGRRCGVRGIPFHLISRLHVFQQLLRQ